MVRLRNLARRRRLDQQRADATAAVARLTPLPDTDHERQIRKDTSLLYKKLTELTDAGKIQWDPHHRDWVKRPIIIHGGDQDRPPAYSAGELLDRFDRVKKTAKGWTARCTAHEDRHPSLSISSGDTGWLITCWAGCDFNEIVTTAGIDIQKMFFE